MLAQGLLEGSLRRPRLVVLAGIAAITALAWLYLARLTLDTDMAMAGATVDPWRLEALVLMFVMWVVMMTAMMLPSATPAILLYATITRGRAPAAPALSPASAFVLGYLAAWAGFSVAATAAQAALQAAALLSPTLVATSGTVGGLLFIAAGLYQWTPLKHACLAHCRSPLDFLSAHWRPGRRGAFVMGLRHGAFCLGCCGVLMGLLFAVGVMNLLWIAALAALVAVEKMFPAGPWAARISGAALVLVGAALLTDMEMT